MLEAMNPLGLLFIGVGVLALAGSVCDWDWFMNARKARFMVTILTRNGTRIFYALLGLALLALGTLATLGLIDLAKDATG
jgi:Immunity protein 17